MKSYLAKTGLLTDRKDFERIVIPARYHCEWSAAKHVRCACSAHGRLEIVMRSTEPDVRSAHQPVDLLPLSASRPIPQITATKARVRRTTVGTAPSKSRTNGLS